MTRKVSEPFSATTTDGIPSRAADRSCENCLAGRNIKPYHFYVGKKISKKTKIQGIPLYYGKQTTTTTYQMALYPIKTYICDDCIKSLQSRELNYLIILGVCYLLCIIALLAWDIGNIVILFIIWLTLIFIIPVVKFCSNVNRTENEVGTNLAIALYKKRMGSSRFDSFFSPSKYSKLVKKRY